MSDAIRLLIVDDEPPVIEGLRATIERELPGFTVVGSASNGREAIEHARTLHPDVVLLDVQMPGIDGIEALRTMREQGVRSIAILVTAYERFDVARRGYGLGVRDYLVKPVGPRTIREALHKAEEEIRRERDRDAHVVEISEGHTRVLRIVERALLHLLLAGAAGTSIVREMLEHLALDGRTVLPVLVHHDTRRPAREICDRVRYTVHGLVGPIDPGRILALEFRPGPDPAAIRARIERALRGGDGETDATLTLGDVAPLEGIGAAVRELVGATTLTPDIELFRLRTAIVRSVRLGDAAAATALLDEYVGESARYGIVAEALEALLVMAADATGGHRGATVDRALAAIVESRKLHDVEAAIGVARERLREWIGSAEEGSLTPMVRSAVTIVRSEFDSELSIEEIADRLSVSSSHLSRTFSAEVGQPLSAYLADVRLQHACELLEAGELSIKEIAVRCGYRDPNYFSRAFRGATGVAPSEYARDRSNREQA